MENERTLLRSAKVGRPHCSIPLTENPAGGEVEEGLLQNEEEDEPVAQRQETTPGRDPEAQPGPKSQVRPKPVPSRPT